MGAVHQACISKPSADCRAQWDPHLHSIAGKSCQAILLLCTLSCCLFLTVGICSDVNSRPVLQDFQAVGAPACKDLLQRLFRNKDILKVRY